MNRRLREVMVVLVMLAGFALLAAGTVSLRAHMQAVRAEHQAALVAPAPTPGRLEALCCASG